MYLPGRPTWYVTLLVKVGREHTWVALCDQDSFNTHVDSKDWDFGLQFFRFDSVEHRFTPKHHDPAFEATRDRGSAAMEFRITLRLKRDTITLKKLAGDAAPNAGEGKLAVLDRYTLEFPDNTTWDELPEVWETDVKFGNMDFDTYRNFTRQEKIGFDFKCVTMAAKQVSATLGKLVIFPVAKKEESRLKRPIFPPLLTTHLQDPGPVVGKPSAPPALKTPAPTKGTSWPTLAVVLVSVAGVACGIASKMLT
jgi:hypothetical protein